MGDIQVFNDSGIGDSPEAITRHEDRVGRAVDIFAPKTRVHTAQEWQESNPALQQGSFGYDSTNRRVKVGDGFTSWNDLEFIEDHGLDLIREEYGDETSFYTALAEILTT